MVICRGDLYYLFCANPVTHKCNTFVFPAHSPGCENPTGFVGSDPHCPEQSHLLPLTSRVRLSYAKISAESQLNTGDSCAAAVNHPTGYTVWNTTVLAAANKKQHHQSQRRQLQNASFHLLPPFLVFPIASTPSLPNPSTNVKKRLGYTVDSRDEF